MELFWGAGGQSCIGDLENPKPREKQLFFYSPDAKMGPWMSILARVGDRRINELKNPTRNKTPYPGGWKNTPNPTF